MWVPDNKRFSYLPCADIQRQQMRKDISANRRVAPDAACSFSKVAFPYLPLRSLGTSIALTRSSCLLCVFATASFSVPRWIRLLLTGASPSFCTRPEPSFLSGENRHTSLEVNPVSPPRNFPTALSTSRSYPTRENPRSN